MGERLYSRDRQLRAIKKIDADTIPEDHPVRRIQAEYALLAEVCQAQFVPDLDEFMGSIGPDLADFCMSIVPVEADPYIDFMVLQAGSKIPGAAGLRPGRLYTDDIDAGSSQERLTELASCLALKRSRLSEAVSARKGSVNIKIFRGVFPVWNKLDGRHGIVLAIAPVYATAKQVAGTPEIS